MSLYSIGKTPWCMLACVFFPITTTQQPQPSQLVNTFPEVLGCGVDTIVRPNVEVLQKQWKIKGNTLVKTLLRRPDVLGYNLDCEGSCVGECERCWARF